MLERRFFLHCLVDITPHPLPQAVPTPSIEWFYGPTNALLPSGVTEMEMSSNESIYNSTLRFSQLQLSNIGIYTCRLNENERLSARTIVHINCHGMSH